MGPKHRLGLTCPPKAFVGRFLIWLVTVGLLLGSTLRLQADYFSWRNRMEFEVENIRVLKGKDPSNSVKYDIFMYIGCTVSPFAAVLWHFNQAVKVCDADNLDSSCNIKMNKNYNYDFLGHKAKDWLLSSDFNTLLDRSDVVVKLDDDTIISKTILDNLVSEFAAADCKYAGNMRKTQAGFYWSNGPLFMVKTDYLRSKLKDNSGVLSYYNKAEDVQMGALLDITNSDLICNVDLDTFRHRYYEDKRLSIRYKPYITC
ncbi:hypothetical protein BX616_000092 [Lobosporangium transversale]|uniref:Uncharacterized protein n=1 Tax=Lobosporangium transversale TaxID=64571 RepID=A0A1Y2GGB0_9FUNG|nr:hypothetical protein BCR41DRAFT_388147 [Lobosporangium transversale]KAF9917731.1 hypothetical protein BX616_000092 [Lobosporangium transversale]ORZ10037.1 hypothetical protein BCR41DRAFT_388147 [Lobosporangium transversale]|eukprot:XP_021879127.1 hypothetical protein BCR41DRAFT_388147 [Lobosporangium transversale]